MVLSEIEQSIKNKVEAVGKPLKEWDVKIYRGVLTGCNDSFIVSTEKRDEILSNCKTEEEREKTCEIIRPILRGRDIRRYAYDWHGLWLINTHNGLKGKIPPINIEDYPAIKAHLDQYWAQIKDRADQGVTPYNLRNCAYLDDFQKRKIIWKRIGSKIRFSYDCNGILGLDSTCFATGSHIPYICCVLNSSMGHYLLQDAPRTGTGDLLISVQAIEPVKIPPVPADEETFETLVNEATAGHVSEIEETMERLVFDLYGLNEDEREYIINNYR